MKLAVLFKWAANPRDARIADDGSVDWSGTRGVISAYDQAAIEVGRRFADAVGGQLVGVTATPEPLPSAACRTALSHGLDHLVVVTGPELTATDPTTTGLVLAAAVTSLGLPDLVLSGEASLDVGAGLVPAVVAGALGWPMIDQVTAVHAVGRGVGLTRRTPHGEQSLTIAGPAVVEIQRYAATPRVPGLRATLDAAKRPTTQLGVADLAVAIPTPVAVVAQAPAVAPEREGRRIEGDPAAMASSLVATLRSRGLLP